MDILRGLSHPKFCVGMTIYFRQFFLLLYFTSIAPKLDFLG